MAGLDNHYEGSAPDVSVSRKKGKRETATVEYPRRIGDHTLFYALAWVIGAFARRGNLTLAYRNATEMKFGDGTGPRFRVRISSLRTIFRIMRNPDLGCGEAYVDGGWILEQGDLAGLLGMFLRNEAEAAKSIPGKTLRALNKALFRSGRNNPRKSRRNVAHHYDIGNALYTRFLDDGMNYSCAFFETPEQSLRDAQLNKLRTSVRRLDIPTGARVLDIGSGWGELTRVIATETGAGRVTGVTLAEKQAELATARASGLDQPRPQYLLEDYRLHARKNPGAYDRIISIGMFEHVGPRNFVQFFDAVRQMLDDDGRALIHSIMKPTRADTSAWFRKYIFPGGYIPTLDDAVAAARMAGLELAHEPFVHESFHYAETLRCWRDDFNRNWPQMDHEKYDERFRRMWNFYLAGSEAAFDAKGMYVAQILLKKSSGS